MEFKNMMEVYMLVLGMIELLSIFAVIVDFGCVSFDPSYDGFTGLFKIKILYNDKQTSSTVFFHFY